FAGKENREYGLAGLFPAASCNNSLGSSCGRHAISVALWRRAGRSCSGERYRSRTQANSKERCGARNHQQSECENTRLVEDARDLRADPVDWSDRFAGFVRLALSPGTA